MAQARRKDLARHKGTLARCERGATAIEYAMVIAMIALAIISALGLVADKTINMWTNVANEVNNH